MLLAILNISDGLFTFNLIERNSTEENPVMAWFLCLAAWPFMTAEFVLTSSALFWQLILNIVIDNF